MASEGRRDRGARRRARFGEALAAALGVRSITQRDLGARLGGVTQSSISAWRSGHAEPLPDTVFAAERVLGLRPGTLSRHLGYVPNEALDKPPSSFDQVVAEDPLLDVVQKRALLAVYREFTNRPRR